MKNTKIDNVNEQNIENRIEETKTKLIINNSFQIHNLIDKGSFGLVYNGINIKTNEPVAIKLERKDKLLEHEYNIYKNIYNSNFKIPQIYWFGKIKDFNILVMQKLGVSLEKLFDKCGRKFSLKTTIMIGVQICDLLENLHKNNYIHRDLKPENFLIGLGNNNRYIYMIDYGLARRYKTNNIHAAQQKGKNLIGTSRYASINSHIGNDLSRRDDFESLIYILIYFHRGSLLWQGVPGKTKEEKHKNISNKKCSITNEELCKEMPHEFLLLIQYIKNLEFKEKPNYKYIKYLFIKMLEDRKLIFDYKYDWD
jgi:serine/threonine protein kinase